MAAYFDAHLVDRVPILCTLLDMFVSPFVPSPLALVMGRIRSPMRHERCATVPCGPSSHQ